MQGLLWVIENMGQSLMRAEQQIAKLTAELEQANAKLAEGTTSDDNAN